MPGSYCYLFEAKGIQKYILDSGRLVDLIGASDLVSDLCRSDENDLLSEILNAAGASEITYSRRAGGSLCLHSDDPDTLDRVRSLWRLAIGLKMPGLPYTDNNPRSGMGENEGKALQAAYSTQSKLRENTAAFLFPTGGPITEFNPRTDRVAVGYVTYGDETVFVDGVTKAQRERGKQLGDEEAIDRLAQVFLPVDTDRAKEYRFPRHFELADANVKNPAFPFRIKQRDTGHTGDSRIAVIHADISGLGQVFRSITNKVTTAKEVRDVAAAIERAISNAARQASEDCLLPYAASFGDLGFAALFGKRNTENLEKDVKIVPARPVLLGGDDITIITRADLAIDFTRSLLDGITRETLSEFKKLKGDGIPKYGLSACAGVAIVSSGNPFLVAHRMAEGMCAQAKKVAKSGGKTPFPSYLSFAVITSNIDESFMGDYREREQKTTDGLYLNGGPYQVSSGDFGGVPLSRLLDLAAALSKTLGYGKLMESLSLRHENKMAATPVWDRFWKVLQEDDGTAHKAVLIALWKCLEASEIEDVSKLPDFEKALPVLNDVLELLDIGAIREGELYDE